MKLNSKVILELVGVTGVIISLAFVGYQLMLERRVALADSYAMSMESRKADLRMQLESEVFLQAMESRWENEGPPDWYILYLELTDTPSAESIQEIHALRTMALLNLLNFSNSYFRYQQGLILEETWAVTRSAIKAQLRSPLHRATFLTSGDSISALIDDLIEEIESENGT